MSGHSKWATIKHKKGALDAKRGKIFTRLIKEITIAAKGGGGDPDGNPRLRGAIVAAKAENMPADNIKRAIQKGTGELEGAAYEEIRFEGYGPGGVAVIVDTLSDNRNRAVSEIRFAFSKNGGNLGETGSVGYLFSKKGVIVVAKSAADEDKLTEIVLEAGADDLTDEGENWEILTTPQGLRGSHDRPHRRQDQARTRGSDDDLFHLHQARGSAGCPDDAPARGHRRPGRHAGRLLQLRHG